MRISSFRATRVFLTGPPCCRSSLRRTPTIPVNPFTLLLLSVRIHASKKGKAGLQPFAGSTWPAWGRVLEAVDWRHCLLGTLGRCRKDGGFRSVVAALQKGSLHCHVRNQARLPRFVVTWQSPGVGGRVPVAKMPWRWVGFLGWIRNKWSARFLRALPPLEGYTHKYMEALSINQLLSVQAVTTPFLRPSFVRKSGVYLFACEERPQTPLCDRFALSALPFASRPLAFSLFSSLSHLSNAYMCSILLRAGDHVFQKSVYSTDASLP